MCPVSPEYAACDVWVRRHGSIEVPSTQPWTAHRRSRRPFPRSDLSSAPGCLDPSSSGSELGPRVSRSIPYFQVVESKIHRRSGGAFVFILQLKPGIGDKGRSCQPGSPSGPCVESSIANPRQIWQTNRAAPVTLGFPQTISVFSFHRIPFVCSGMAISSQAPFFLRREYGASGTRIRQNRICKVEVK
jgi:hypothetical protein